MEEPAYFQNMRREGRVVVSEAPKLDIEPYIANYKGKLRIERLHHIGRHSVVLYNEALQLAASEAKQGKDTELYSRVVETWQAIDWTNSNARKDENWILKTTRENKAESVRLESELKGYKNNLIKESIRMGYDDTGKHYQDIGELGEATRAFTKERECAQTPTHVGIMLQRLINVAIEQQNWLTVESNVQKVRSIAQSTPSAGKNEAIYTALLGLAQMSSRNYNAATGTFLSVNNSLLQNKPEALDDPSLSTLTSSDIATYGALCAMATLDRSQLQSRVLDNANFRAFLEVEPHLRRCVTAFISGKFASCLSILDSYRPDYLLDLYLAPHFMELFDKIRSKAIVQYFVPFSVVTFKALAEAFNTTEEVIETSLIELIKSNSLPGRLDLENGTLLANKVDSRNAVHAEALRTAKAYERTIHLRILRMEAMHNQLEVGAGGKQPQSQQHYQDTITAQEQGSFATPFQGMGNTLKGAGQKFFGGPQG